MKQIRIMFSLVAVAAITAFFAGITGCDTNNGDTDTGVDAYFASHPYLNDPRANPDIPGKTGVFSVNPATAEATTIGQQISITVQNGVSPFTWDVADPSAGSVTTTDNSRYGVYTVAQITRNSVIVSDNEGRAAIVAVSASGSGALTIIPATTTLTGSTNDISMLAGTKIQFQVSGGTPPYGSWQATMSGMGTIDSSSGLYTVTTPLLWTGINTITIKDSAGVVVSATVTVQFHP